jgi:hypothetical protein
MGKRGEMRGVNQTSNIKSTTGGPSESKPQIKIQKVERKAKDKKHTDLDRLGPGKKDDIWGKRSFDCGLIKMNFQFNYLVLA